MKSYSVMWLLNFILTSAFVYGKGNNLIADIGPILEYHSHVGMCVRFWVLWFKREFVSNWVIRRWGFVRPCHVIRSGPRNQYLLASFRFHLCGLLSCFSSMKVSQREGFSGYVNTDFLILTSRKVNGTWMLEVFIMRFHLLSTFDN